MPKTATITKDHAVTAGPLTLRIAEVSPAGKVVIEATERKTASLFAGESAILGRLRATLISINGGNAVIRFESDDHVLVMRRFLVSAAIAILASAWTPSIHGQQTQRSFTPPPRRPSDTDAEYAYLSELYRRGSMRADEAQRLKRELSQRQTTTADWQWSKPAAHHWTLVSVQTPSGSSGSGVYVQFDCDCHPETGMRGVLTAAHVVSSAGTAAVRWVDGKSSRGAVTYAREYDQYGRDHRGDVAWVNVQRQDVTPVPVLPQIQNGPVEVAGYGGPTDKRRHFWASASPDQSGGLRCVSKATATNGDSGGPWYQSDFSGRVGVVGINHGTGGYDAEFVHAGSSDWIIGTESVSVGPRVINRFLGRVVKTAFG